MIDGTDQIGSPAWWLQRLFQQLADRKRHTRLQMLENYHSGHAPLPEGAENAREAYEAFQKKARTNWAELIVTAVAERMTPTGFWTSFDSDETGDAEVGALWERAGMLVRAADVHDKMLALSEAYAIVGPMDPETGAPRITAEDPRWTVGEPDPDDDRRLLAALKVRHDDWTGDDLAYLFLPGRSTPTGRTQIWVARKRVSVYSPSAIAGIGAYRPTMWVDFSPKGWDWDVSRSGELAHPLMPVVRFTNWKGKGEYETHTDHIDRINHQVLQRMVITTLQAFRQKAIKGLPAKDPKTGQAIDYTGMFTSDPGALWQLPAAAEMWESTPTDIRPILDSVKDDVQQLAAVTKTPMHMMMPEGANQSAEGAATVREAFNTKVGDRIDRTSGQHARLMAVTLVHAGMSDRADLAKLRTMWAPVERLSLSERADAAAKAANDLPRRSRLIHIWKFSPAEADRIMSEWEYDQLVAAQMAQAMAAAQQIQLPGQQANALPGQQGGQQGGQPQIGQGGQRALPSQSTTQTTA